MSMEAPHVRGEDFLQPRRCAPKPETPPRAWGRVLRQAARVEVRRNTPTGVGKSRFVQKWQAARRKHPHGRGEELHYCYITVALLETPPRAWGRVNAPCVQAMSNGNTPTGVGKSVIAKHNGKNSQKHPHGRGEEIKFNHKTMSIEETPPRAWGRVRPRRLRPRLSRKHPHGRGEEFYS